jgi:hypothetical protein
MTNETLYVPQYPALGPVDVEVSDKNVSRIKEK